MKKSKNLSVIAGIVVCSAASSVANASIATATVSNDSTLVEMNMRSVASPYEAKMNQDSLLLDGSVKTFEMASVALERPVKPKKRRQSQPPPEANFYDEIIRLIFGTTTTPVAQVNTVLDDKFDTTKKADQSDS
jgi:transcriptional regulator of nitric oxide reductase